MKIPPLFIFLSLTLSLILQTYGDEEKIIELDPFEVTTNHYVYWGFSSKYNFKSPFVPNFIDEVTSIEVGSVFKGGTADLCDLKTGDMIVEINGKWNFNKNELNRVLDEISLGDKIELKILKPNGEEVFKVVEAISFPEQNDVTFCTNGITVTFQDAKNWLDHGRYGKRDKALIKFKDTPLFTIEDGTSRTFTTLSDNITHTIKSGIHIIYDKNLNYQITNN